jgi:leucyl aminopeptidase
VHVEARTGSPLASGADTIAVGVFDGEGPSEDLPPAIQELVRAGEARGTLSHLAVTHGDGRRLIASGLGPRARFGPEPARRVAAAVHARAADLGAETLCWGLPQGAGAQIARAIVEGTLLRGYRFDRYKPPSGRPAPERLILAGERDFTEIVRRAAIVAGAQNRARDLGNAPGNDLPPAALADYALRLAERHDTIATTVLDEQAIRDAGMGAFAAVAQGSAQEARLIEIRYDGPGANETEPRLALIGKAVTFDSGGLSLKPPAAMHEMKFDMCGGAAVIEAIAALAELSVPVRVLGLVGATENLPSGTAIKPGDIVQALDGTTIEIDNTDAEGRLVLADCICYARAQGCGRLIDAATLTGGVVIALGSFYAGLLGNDDQWVRQVESAAERAGEPVWRLPLDADYANMVKGRYAQLTNRPERREAQAVTAAEFLHHFAGEVPWAHLDIAGTAYDVPLPYFAGKGATGFGVRLLVELASSAGA